jgi:prepilin-type N-terminal cleavage/methylation domain-containing protein
MKLRKAFTLIELLVVIAIIAILAAILFPVFAQAKLMAKAAASTSNQKQIALAEIMYASDNDDFACPTTCWGNWSFPFWWGTQPTLCAPWAYAIMSYTKNMNLVNDPTGPVFSPGANQGLGYNAGNSIDPVYGYDYCVMAPFYQGAGDYTNLQHPTASSSFLAPTSTVMFGSRGYTPSESVAGIGGNPGVIWIFALAGAFPGGPLLNMVVDPPECYTILPWCLDNWGTGGQWGNGGGFAMTTVTAGMNTGGVSARAPQNQEGTVSFCDGHAKKLSWSQMAVGTNYSPIQGVGSLGITNSQQYMWFINANFGY